MAKDGAPAGSPAEANIYAFGAHRLDVARRMLVRDGSPVALTPKAFDLLVILVEHRDRVIAKNELVRLLWSDSFVTDESLTQQISALRKALGETAHDQQFIATLPRRGYRFVADAVVEDARAAEALSRREATATDRRGWRRFAVRAAFVLLLAAIASVTAWLNGAFDEPTTSVGGAVPPVRLTTVGGLVSMPAISKDGTMIAYTAAAPGESHFDIWVQQVAGGRPLRLTTDPHDDVYPTFSPDGATIAFQRPQGPGAVAHRAGTIGSTAIYLVPTLGGESRLFLPEGGDWPSFSPDGRWLAYHRGIGVAASTMWIAPLRGGAPTRLAKDLTAMDRFVWSPDSAHLLAAGHRERWPPFHNDWFLVPVDGGPVVATDASTALAVSSASSALGEANRDFPKPLAWHPQGNRIVYHMPYGDTKNLWQVRFDPNTKRVVGPAERLTGGTHDEELASVSATGRMVYTSYDLRADLWSVPLAADGVSARGPLQQLTDDVVDDFNPDVSPDGRLVAFASRRHGQEFIVVVRDLDTGQERESGRFTEMPGPLFSADGRSLAYSLRRPGGGPLFITDIATGSVEQMCEKCGLATQWNHTMGELVIGSLQSQDGLTVFAVRERRLRSLVPSEGLYLFVPSFSPDGQWLTFSVAAEEAASFVPRIVITPVRNGVPAPRDEWITVAEGHQLGRWTAKGSALIFWSACDAMPCIVAQRLDRSSKRPVGPPLEIIRFPDRTLSPRDIQPSNGLSVGLDRIVFTHRSGEISG
jgi:DNA-binding winged helix-turn-helix (wHTH) protein/Tol biopolymer transport system component